MSVVLVFNLWISAYLEKSGSLARQFHFLHASHMSSQRAPSDEACGLQFPTVLTAPYWLPRCSLVILASVDIEVCSLCRQ